MTKPLAERMRPTSLEHFYGQEHLLGKTGVLRTIITSETIPSIILWGPPRCRQDHFGTHHLQHFEKTILFD